MGSSAFCSKTKKQKMKKNLLSKEQIRLTDPLNRPWLTGDPKFSGESNDGKDKNTSHRPGSIPPSLGLYGFGRWLGSRCSIDERPRTPGSGVPGYGRGDRRQFFRSCQYLWSRKGRRNFRPGTQGKTVTKG